MVWKRMRRKRQGSIKIDTDIGPKGFERVAYIIIGHLLWGSRAPKFSLFWSCLGVLGCIPGYNRMHTRVYSGVYSDSYPGMVGCIVGYTRMYTLVPPEYINKNIHSGAYRVYSGVNPGILGYVPGYTRGLCQVHQQVYSGV